MRYKLDFSCAGTHTLRDACTAQGLNAERVLEELEDAALDEDDIVGWDARPLDDLIDHIIEAYHEPLRDSLPTLQAMAEKVDRLYGEAEPNLGSLYEVIIMLRSEIEQHMQKEELVLFPWIRSGNGHTAGQPIRVMTMDHETAGNALERIRELTNEFTLTSDACKTRRALWRGLEELNASLRCHIHLENNVLFPRALAGV